MRPIVVVLGVAGVAGLVAAGLLEGRASAAAAARAFQKVTVTPDVMTVSAAAGQTVEFDLPKGASWAPGNTLAGNNAQPPTSGSDPIIATVPKGTPKGALPGVVMWKDAAGTTQTTHLVFTVTG